MKIQRIPTAATMVSCNAEWFPRTRLALGKALIELGLEIGGISFLNQGNPMRSDKRRMQLRRIV